MTTAMSHGKSTSIPDRYLWLGLAAIAFLAARGIRAAITDASQKAAMREAWKQNANGSRESVELGVGNGDENGEGGGNGPTTDPEDAISLSTLRMLCRSPNSKIAFSAQDLLARRVNANPSETAIWLASDLRSTDEKTALRAANALVWLQESGHANEVLAELQKKGVLGGMGDVFGEYEIEDINIPEREVFARNARARDYGEENFHGGRDHRAIEEANRFLDERGAAMGMRRARREAVVIGGGEGNDGQAGGGGGRSWWVA